MPSKIDWTDETWNPIRGCTPVSPGCRNCYAKQIVHRFAHTWQSFDLTERRQSGIEWTGKIELKPDVIQLPTKWKKRRLVFVCSMSDLFHKDVPDDFIYNVWCEMFAQQRHTFQVLTKRIDRAAAWLLGEPSRVMENGQPALAYKRSGPWSDAGAWPLSNVWIMCSAEDQRRFDERVSALVHNCPAAIRGVSLEPLLGPIDMGAYIENLDWVIVGCESGPRARHMKIEWVRAIRDQCMEAAVPFFFKQQIIDGRKATMPPLDGVVWNEMPMSYEKPLNQGENNERSNH